MPNVVISQELIETKIFFIRRKKVMLDKHLAELYGVTTSSFNQAVKRNLDRFPSDFMYQITRQELTNLKSQIVISSWGGIRKLPFAFTEHGILMLSSVLNSERAIQVNIQIMRTFTRLREMLLSYKELKEKIEAMERKYDEQFAVVFDAIKKLLEPPASKPKRKIGFQLYPDVA